MAYVIYEGNTEVKKYPGTERAKALRFAASRAKDLKCLCKVFLVARGSEQFIKSFDGR